VAKFVRRLVRWAVLAAAIDVVLRLARNAKQRQVAARAEPPAEPPWPLPAAKTTVEIDEPPAPVAAEAAWVAANGDGGCPDGYPVKVKVRSGIFHTPGMLNYDRTAPDRCYASADAAEADGYRPAKR